MSKQELTEKLKYSILSKKMLEVVSIGVVKVGDEFIILKQRPRYEFKEDDAILYSEHHDIGHHYKELIAKTVIFDQSLFGLRGNLAIREYLDKK